MKTASDVSRKAEGESSGVSPSARRKHGNRSLRRWAAAVVVTVLVHGAAYFVLRVPMPDLSEHQPRTPQLMWVGRSRAGTGSLLGEQLMLFDNAPLFLPTPWNAASAENVTAQSRSPMEIFDSYGPRMTVAQTRTPRTLDVLPTGIRNPREGLGRFRWNYFESFGRIDAEPPKLALRLAQIEVRTFSTDETVYKETVPLAESAGVDAWPFWAPFEIMALVGQAGMRAPPLVVPRGSGSGTVDAFFRDYVLRELRLDVRLAPGYYRIVVGP